MFRDVVASMMKLLSVRPVVEADVPPYVEVTTRGVEEGLVVHFVNYLIERKSRTIDTLETVVPLMNRSVSIQSQKPPVRVTQYDPACEEMRELPFAWSEGRVTLVIPILTGHEMILLHGAGGATRPLFSGGQIRYSA